MKKIILSALALLWAVGVNAQTPKTFFPTTEGTTLINKTYDGSDSLLATAVYTVLESTQNEYRQADSEVRYVMMDGGDKVVAQGIIETMVDDGRFSMHIRNSGIMPDPMKTLSLQADMIGDFIDYPNTFSELDAIPGVGEIQSSEYNMETNDGDFYRVRLMNRIFEKNETISTPAGDFDAIKTRFDLMVVEDNRTDRLYGHQWYAYGAGIVKTEIYDEKDNLLNYTVLTEMTNSGK